MNLIDRLIADGHIKTPRIIDAFKKINRRDFVRPFDLAESEIDEPLGIGHGQTISQPYTVAFMIEKLAPESGEKILDIGSGSGWSAALLAEIVGEKGKVYGLEIVSELASFGENNISKYNFIKKGIVQIFCTDGNYGLPEKAPFDRIHIAAAAEEIPLELLKQLKTGGRMILPIGRQFESQEIIVVDKVGENDYREKRFPGFVFVPLVKK